MKDVIRLLPDSVANQIAAGEVIQRPASVIKELVENAVDAGATDIRIYIKDAGRTLIQVVDNGCGMSATDARMAFERHATSKIQRADDLFTLNTMGFRGEALPSICAISQVVLRTRPEGEQMGTLLIINGSKVELQEPCVCEKGTSMSVKNLFFNVPARRKFLKSDNVELSQVMREFERLALVNNHIRMSIDTGSKELDLRAASFHQRINDIWKNNLKMQLLPIEVDTSIVKIRGFISRPEFARRRNALQFLIVNGRNMRHPYFHKAIVSCFDNLIASDTQPCYFLKFEVDPSTIDVNIHPTKNEIKFELESEIWPLLVAGVKASLGKNAAVPSIDFEADAIPVAVAAPGQQPERPVIDMPQDYNPFNAAAPQPDYYGSNFSGGNTFGGSFSGGNSFSGNSGDGSQYGESRQSRQNTYIRNWEKLYENFISGAPATEAPTPESAPLPGLGETDIPLKRMCLQVAQKYIATSSREGLLIIDQHRAHVKVLYEEYRATIGRERGVAQKVMFPEEITLDEAQQAALAEVESELARLGFELEYEEDTRWRITSIPSNLRNADPKDVVMRILDSVTEDSSNYGKDQMPVDALLDRLCLLMARSAAITGGLTLSEEEMEKLVADLFALPDPTFTPNGNRIYTILDPDSLSRLI